MIAPRPLRSMHGTCTNPATGSHVIPIFENADDVARYHNQIEEGQENPPLTVVEVQTDTIVSACRERNQKCVIITVDDFMIPPIEA